MRGITLGWYMFYGDDGMFGKRFGIRTIAGIEPVMYAT